MPPRATVLSRGGFPTRRRTRVGTMVPSPAHVHTTAFRRHVGSPRKSGVPRAAPRNLTDGPSLDQRLRLTRANTASVRGETRQIPGLIFERFIANQGWHSASLFMVREDSKSAGQTRSPIELSTKAAREGTARSPCDSGVPRARARARRARDVGTWWRIEIARRAGASTVVVVVVSSGRIEFLTGQIKRACSRYQ